MEQVQFLENGNLRVFIEGTSEMEQDEVSSELVTKGSSELAYTVTTFKAGASPNHLRFALKPMGAAADAAELVASYEFQGDHHDLLVAIDNPATEVPWNIGWLLEIHLAGLINRWTELHRTKPLQKIWSRGRRAVTAIGFVAVERNWNLLDVQEFRRPKMLH